MDGDTEGSAATHPRTRMTSLRVTIRKKRFVVSLAVVGALLGGGLGAFTTGILAKGCRGGVYSITFLGAEVYEYVGPWDNFSTIANVWLLGLMLVFGVIGAAVGGKVGDMLSRRITSVGPDDEQRRS